MTVTEIDDKAALVLIDLQVGTLSAPTVPHAPGDVVGRAVRLAEAFRGAGATVVLVRMANAADGSDAVRGRSEAARRAAVEGGGARRPHDLGPIADALAGHEGDVLVTKGSSRNNF
jgi:nicotinamidase-related amidase